MIVPNRLPTPLLLALLLLLLGSVVVGCDRQRQIGSITQYTRGGQGGGSSQGSVGGSGKTGVVTLNALYTGALIGAGSPELGLLVPSDGEGDALPTTLVVAVFSESIDPDSVDSSTFILQQAAGGGVFEVPLPVPATVAVDLATDGRVAILIPSEPLLFGGQYSIVLDGVKDLEGNLVEASASSDESDEPGGPFGGGGGGAGPASTFQVFLPGFASPRFGVIAMYPPPGDDAASRETIIRLFFNAPVDEASIAAIEVNIGNSAVSGEVEALLDPRVVQFTPDDPFPLGATVAVTVPESVSSGPIQSVAPSGLSLSGGEFVAMFSINDVPTPSAIKLPDNTPVTVAGLTYDGSLTLSNLKDFKADVKVPSGKPNATDTTLLFFQPKGAKDAAARAFSKEKGVGTVSFKVNLGKGDDAAAFVDSGESFPPQPVLLGAFAQRGALRSPVGPDDLPQVFVKTSKPDVVFGPPSEDDAPYTFRTVLGTTAVYGTASEAVAALRLVVNGAAIPSTLDALGLSGPASVTDGALFFMTQPPVGAIPGSEVGPGPHYLPLPIDEITVTDIVGNQRVIKAPETGSIHYEGSIGGALEATVLEDLRVRVVAADTLKPVKGAEVRLDIYPFDTGNAPLVMTTGKGGEAVFDDTSGLGGALFVTASKSGFDVVSLAGFDNPAAAGAMGISLVMKKTDVPRLEVRVDTKDDIPAEIQNQAFVASGASSGRPATGKNPTVADSRFFVDDLGLKTKTHLRVEPARPFIVSNFEHDGDQTYALFQSDIQASAEDVTLEFSYADKGATMDFAQSFANTIVQTASVTNAGITETPYDVTVGRLVGTLPGLPDVFPVSFSPQPLGAPGATRTLFAPIPPSLWVNEAPPDVDPAYEIMMQPGAATGVLPPTESRLEQTFRFEIEAAEVGSTRLTRQRAALDFIPAVEAKTSEPIALPNVYDVLQVAGTFHPPEIGFFPIGTNTPFVAGRSLVRATLQRASSSVKWTVLVDATASGLTPGELAFPDIGLDPFDQPGMFEVSIEVIEMPAGFDFDAFTCSDVDRDHRRLSRSETMTFDTTP